MCPRVCVESLKAANLPLTNLNHSIYCVPKEGYTCECQRLFDDMGEMQYEEMLEGTNF